MTRIESQHQTQTLQAQQGSQNTNSVSQANNTTIQMVDDNSIESNNDSFERSDASNTETTPETPPATGASEAEAARKRALESQIKKEDSQLYQLNNQLTSIYRKHENSRSIPPSDEIKIMDIKSSIRNTEIQRLSEERLSDSEKNMMSAIKEYIQSGSEAKINELKSRLPQKEQKILSNTMAQLKKVPAKYLNDVSNNLIAVLIKNASGEYDKYGENKIEIYNSLITSTSMSNRIITDSLKDNNPPPRIARRNAKRMQEMSQSQRKLHQQQADVVAGYNPATGRYSR